MRRLSSLLLLAAAPLLLSAADPLVEAEREVQAAEREQGRLEQAMAAARSSAERARAEAAASAQAILAAEARIAATEVRLAALLDRQQRLEARLAEARRPTTALLAGLVQMGRRPPLLALAQAAEADEQVRLAALVRHVRPLIDQRSAGLRTELQALQRVGEQERVLQRTLAAERERAASVRTRFAALEEQALRSAERAGAAALGAGDQVLGRSERLSSLRSEAEQRRQSRRLAAELAGLPAAIPRPSADQGSSANGGPDWQVPAAGPVTLGLGELLPTGVRSRGVTIAAARGTQVVAPAAGRVAFAGPFRQRAGVLIIDHGGGWMTMLTEVRPAVPLGQRVEAGTPIGRALGPVTAELFREGTPEPAALIPRSSGPLLSSRKTG